MNPSMRRLACAACALLLLNACTTTRQWYDYIQGGNYMDCNKITDTQRYRECQQQTRPDYDKYQREREAAKR